MEYKYDFELSSKGKIFLYLYQIIPNLDIIKYIYEMKDKIEELQNKLIYLENEISNQKIDSKNKEKKIHQSYKNEIVKKTNNSLKKNI